MKTKIRRVLLGLGAMLLVAGVGIFMIGHESLHAIVSFGVEDEAARHKVLSSFAGGVFLASLGAGILAAAWPRVRSEEPNGKA